MVVTLIGVDRRVLTLNTDYRFANRTTISTTKAWSAADGYTTIELRRVTSATERLVDFTDGSILRAYDLNVAQIQTMHVAEEARDLTADTLGVNNEGHLDARGRRIVNLANAVDDRDAVPFGQLKTMNQNSWQARNEALQFRNEAEGFKNQAEGFKNESSTNASNTFTWRNDAERFRNEAEQFKNSAGNSATASGNSAAAALASQQAAAVSETNSRNEADRSKTEADRAKSEADKLQNWNDLAGAVDTVLPNKEVRWKAPGHFLYGSRSYLPENPSLFMEWNCHGTTSNPHGEVVCNWGSGRRVLIDWDVVGFVGTYDHNMFLKAGRSSEADAFNARTSHQVLAAGWYGAGAFAHQYSNGTAPFCKIYGYAAPANNSQYQPIVKGIIQTESYGYGTAVSFGSLTSGTAKFADAVIHIMGDNGTHQAWIFGSNGTLSSPNNVSAGGGTLHTDGNLSGPAWEGGNAVSMVNNRINGTRRGPQQFTGQVGGAGEYEIPNGFITGYSNHTGDGNIKYSGWYFRVPQHHTPNGGWAEFQNI